MKNLSKGQGALRGVTVVQHACFLKKQGVLRGQHAPLMHRVHLLKISSGDCLLFDNQRQLELAQNRLGGSITHDLPLFYDKLLDNFLQLNILYRPIADYPGITCEYAAYTGELAQQEQDVRRLVCQMMPYQIRKSFKSETLYGLPLHRLKDTLLTKTGIPLLGNKNLLIEIDKAC